MRRLLPAVMLIALACHRPAPPPLPRVIFVGLDGADWQLLDRYMADGTMPNLAAIVREGHRRVLLTEHPPLSPLVWTTMMTGVSPLEHRILDFTRFNPVTGQREPITSDERAVPAIWNMLSQRGRRVAVFGLWATCPAETVNGTIVSDRLFSFQYDDAPPIGSVYPQSLDGWARSVVQDVSARTGYDALHAYVPALTAAQYASLAANPNPFAHPVTALRRLLIEMEVVHTLATERIERDHPDLAVVYFQGTDAIGHLFAPYAPPKLDSIPQADFDRYHDVPRRYFARIDAILGDYRRLADRTGARLVIASDHGFEWGEHRSPVSSIAVATAARWHRDEGILVVRGAPASAATVREITPMLLDMLGMPRDVSQYRRAWRRERLQAPAVPASEAVAQLQALGYIGASEPASAPPHSTSTRTAGSFDNEALLLRQAGRDDEALAAFESALQIDPKNASTMWNLSDLLRKLHRDGGRAERLLDSALAIDATQPRWLLTRGRMRLEKRDCRGALADFSRAASLAPRDPIAFASSGTASLCMGDVVRARRDFERSLDLDPNQPQLRAALQQMR